MTLIRIWNRGYGTEHDFKSYKLVVTHTRNYEEGGEILYVRGREKLGCFGVLFLGKRRDYFVPVGQREEVKNYLTGIFTRNGQTPCIVFEEELDLIKSD